MIRIACTNCKTVLSIDDAFAGGVCRCQHCGTIQTVPAKARDSAAVAAGSKALFQHNPKSDGAASGTGLDELAGIVASSGLAGSGLRSRRLTTPASGPTSRRNLAPILITVAGVIVVLLGVIAWLMLHRAPVSSASDNAQSSVVVPTAVATGPNFCGVQLSGSSVVYLLDRGSGNREIFAAMIDAALKSVASLGSDRKFQILFWSNGSDDAGYPQSSTTYATRENIEAAKLATRDVSAFGASDIKSAFQKAIANSPELIVIGTAKGPLLDDAWTNDLLSMRGSSPVKIDTLSLGSAGSSEALKALAGKTGGQYKEVGDAELRAYAGQ